MSLRSIVLIEPFGPLDVSIFQTERQADAYTAGLREAGKDYRHVVTTGTVRDLRSHQKELRAAYVERMATVAKAVAS